MPTGHFPGSDEAAVILAEKQPIAEQDLPGLFSRETKLSQSFQNDVYGQHVAMCHAPLGGLRLMTVYPATDAHIRKYSARTMRVLHESPEDYRQITRPFVEREALKLEVGLLGGRILLQEWTKSIKGIRSLCNGLIIVTILR